MARFSVGREEEDDNDGSSSPDPKRHRTSSSTTTTTTTTTRCPIPPPQNRNRNAQGQFGFEFFEFVSDFGVDDEDVELEDFSAGFGVEEEIEEEAEGDDEEEEEEEEGVDIREVVEGVESCQSARSSGDGAISVILSDPDVLDCPICLEQLTVPVFQCENGHVACNCCCSKIKNTCPSCSMPTGYNRCRAIEKVIESIKIACQNLNYGCKETVSYCKKHDHEHVCLHTPISCPNIGCTFINSSKKLYQHFSSKHSDCATRFTYNKLFSVYLTRGNMHEILQEKYEGVIFILNISRRELGTMINVNCIGPTTTKRGYSYDLTAKKGDTSVVLRSVTENVQNWVEGISKKAFLFVPREFDGSSEAPGLFKVEVCIKRPSGKSAGI